MDENGASWFPMTHYIVLHAAELKISMSDLAVFNVLCSYANRSKTHEACPSTRTIAGHLGICIRQVTRNIHNLQAAGLIQRIERVGKSTICKLLPLTQSHTLTPDSESPLTLSHTTPDSESEVPLTLSHPNKTVVRHIQDKSTHVRANTDPPPWALALSERMNECLDAIIPNRRQATKSHLRQWARDLDLLHRVDKVPQVEIARMIEWVREEQFWKSRILSGAKLREKWNTLSAQAGGHRSDVNGAKQAPRPDVDPIRQQAIAETIAFNARFECEMNEARAEAERVKASQ